MQRYLCIHGHFYQPPRENPWLEVIEQQDGARPYHDWNERITVECYAANTASRILDQHGLIERIVNNYAGISFDFGPTLLSWLESHAPEVYEALREADRESQRRFSGHGSAIAQAYNHLILPLATTRDKHTQVFWAISDFTHRFRRPPEGMWLPETAVDLETLAILAEHGIRFTILAPRQARRVRDLRGKEWRDVTGERIDPTTAYAVRLPSGKSIAAFFYHGPIAQAVAFENLLRSGDSLAHRLHQIFSAERPWPQLAHIATDGESYGHHHRFGEMALAYALQVVEGRNLASLTNYGEFLERHPPRHEVELVEKSSWSCAHGVERWRGDCGCSSGAHPEWRQTWRAPLRQALDWLRDTVAPLFDERAGRLLREPWEARNDYIRVILTRSPVVAADFLSRQARRALSEAERVTVLKLMELQRHAMLMYTSCGWFFDDLSSIETIQILRYAGRVLQLAEDLFGKPLEARFLKLLKRARSNIPERGDGLELYKREVKPAVTDLATVGAHYALCSLFDAYAKQARVYCYQVQAEDLQTAEAGKARLVVGRARVTSEITLESDVFGFAALHLGNHNLNGGVKRFSDIGSYETMAAELNSLFAGADFAETIRALDRNFRGSLYTLKSLFRDDQGKLLGRILRATLEEAEAVYRQLYEHHAPLLKFLKDTASPPPKALSTAAEFILNASLHRALANDESDLGRIEQLLRESRLEDVSLDEGTLAYAFGKRLEVTARQFGADPARLGAIERLEAFTALVRRLPFDVNLWQAQNICYRVLHGVCGEFRSRAAKGDREAQRWLDRFMALAEHLLVRVAT
ncbi:MAG: glycoside hydrolase family protein [Deltaproteobacteria bacterium]|nr:glycoside hydrolase family protein [Deltaproteobacteria bacterium]